MSDITLVQGDKGLPIKGQIFKLDGTVRPLTDATGVRFQMRKADDKRYTIDGVATITDEALGKVEYEVQNHDLSVPGEYIAQFEVTYTDGSIQTTDPPNTITVRRQ